MTAPDPLLITPVAYAGHTLLVRPGTRAEDAPAPDLMRLTIGTRPTLERLHDDPGARSVGQDQAHTFVLDAGRARALRHVLNVFLDEPPHQCVPDERPADVDPLPADPVDPDDVDVVLLTADQDRRASALHQAAAVVERLMQSTRQARRESDVVDFDVMDDVLQLARYIEHGDEPTAKPAEGRAYSAGGWVGGRPPGS